METPKRVAVAHFKQVSEDGPEFCSSVSESDHSDHSEELTGVYTEGTSLQTARMTSEQANALCAQARQPTPVPFDDDDSEMTEDQKRLARRASKLEKGRAGGPVTASGPGEMIRVSPRLPSIPGSLSFPYGVFQALWRRELRIYGFGIGFHQGSMPSRASARLSGEAIHPVGA
jgi:hypothetical protein